MNLQTTIKQIANQHNIKVKQTTIYSLNKFINTLNIKPTKAPDFKTMVDKIKDSYSLKSYKSEMYFIQNIAHAFNKSTNESLFDFKTLDLAQNFKSTITEQSLYNCKKIIKDRSSTENEIIQAHNNLETHTHKQNTQFIEQLDAKYAFKKLAKVRYIDFKNAHKIPVMLTFTLDGAYRKYVKDGEPILGEFEGLKEIDKNANLELLIENSYNKLNSVFRNFYSYLKTLNRRSRNKDKLDFIMIFEPHKSLTLHLHTLFYCNDTQLENLERAWNNYLKDLNMKQKKAQDYKLIDTTRANASTYLSKYLIKEYNSDSDGASFFTQFKRYFSRLKLFRTSNFYHTTQAKIDKMYSYLSSNYPDILEHIRLSDTPIYEVLEQFEIQGLFSFEKETINSLVFDRKKIREFYEAYSHTHQDYEIKQEIIDNIEHFTSVTKISRIKEAYYNFDYSIIRDIFKTYDIAIDTLQDEPILADKFYESGMYEMVSFELNHALSLANDISTDSSALSN